MFCDAHLIELSKFLECRIAGPAIHGPFEAFLNNINEANFFQQGLALFPGVEGLSPSHGNVTDGLAPCVEEMIRT